MWAIVGLGNPGIRYRWSRHNIGFQTVDLLAKINNVRLKRDRSISGLTGRGAIGKEEVILLKPTTYMNRSGIAVKGLSRLYDLPPQKMLIISDDIDLPWDRIRIRKGGSSAGHRGVESIINELGTNNFPRLRMGIGRAADSGVVEHVLGGFNAEEKGELKDYCLKAIDAVYMILNKNIDTAMNKFN